MSESDWKCEERNEIARETPEERARKAAWTRKNALIQRAIDLMTLLALAYPKGNAGEWLKDAREELQRDEP